MLSGRRRNKRESGGKWEREKDSDETRVGVFEEKCYVPEPLVRSAYEAR
jgi:hypothetical protein